MKSISDKNSITLDLEYNCDVDMYTIVVDRGKERGAFRIDVSAEFMYYFDGGGFEICQRDKQGNKVGSFGVRNPSWAA